MALGFQVMGQPGDQEIPEIVGAEESRAAENGRALAENPDHAWHLALVHRGGEGFAAGHPEQPGNQPHQAAETQADEQRAPSETGYGKCAHERAQRGSALGAGVNPGVSKASMILGKIGYQNARIARVRNRFAEPQDQPHGK